QRHRAGRQQSGVVEPGNRRQAGGRSGDRAGQRRTARRSALLVGIAVIPALALGVNRDRDRERQNGARCRDGDRLPGAHYLSPSDFLALGFVAVVVVLAFKSLSASCSALVACVVAVAADVCFTV